MRTIYKYPFNVTDHVELYLPIGAKPLTAKVQQDQVCLWAEVDPLKSTEKRNFRVFGTGHEFPAGVNLKYISTFQLNNGQLVFHFYEVLPGRISEKDNIQDAEIVE